MTYLLNQEKVNKCYELVLDHNPSKKRMMQPANPTSVFGASFSSDGSNESWVGSSVSIQEEKSA